MARSVALVSALAVAIGTIGLPANLVPAKDTSIPFPCATRACGCRSARDCWEKCCCFTDREKLAWAQANGVRPPADFLARVENTQKPAIAENNAPPPCPHCAARKTTPVKPAVAPAESSSEDWILTVSAARCQGMVPDWLCIKIATLPTLPVTRSNDQLLTVEILSIPDEQIAPRPLDAPPIPPPEATLEV